MAGFSQIIRKEQDPKTRDHMLDYLTDLMEDSHDFGWQNAKGSHAVLLCKMEDNKISWNQGSPTLIPKVKLKSRMTKNPSHAGFINVALAHIGQTMKLVAKCICTSAPTVILKGKITSIHLKIVRLVQKRVKHCCRAVLKIRNDRTVFKTRIVYNSVIGDVESDNWRYDFDKVTNVTYADIVKSRNTVSYGNHKINMGQTLLNTRINIAKPKCVHIDTNNCRRKVNSDTVKRKEVYIDTRKCRRTYTKDDRNMYINEKAQNSFTYERKVGKNCIIDFKKSGSLLSGSLLKSHCQMASHCQMQVTTLASLPTKFTTSIQYH